MTTPSRSRTTGSDACCGRTSDAGATALAALEAGDRVEVRYRPKASGGGTVEVAVGGSQVLVGDGVVQTSADNTAHPRTAVGFSADGRRTHLLTVD
jgi:hypothetical protein